MLNLLVFFQVQRPPQDRSALSAAGGEWHVTDWGFFLFLFAGTVMLMCTLLSKDLVISVFFETLYTLLFIELQLHILPGFATCMIHFQYAQ